MYEKLTASLRYCSETNSLSLYKRELMKAAADAIEDLSKLFDTEVEINTALECNMPVWIPVTERLPEDHVPVLTCDSKGNIHIFSHYHLFTNPFGIKPTNSKYFMVKWWMPLPEPPKDGTE